MNCGVYGRAFVHHSICGDEDAEHHEVMEERYFFGNPDGYEYENHESINTASGSRVATPLVRVDSPGAGKSPGTLGIWGIDEAEAFYDAIEWAGTQPWSNGERRPVGHVVLRDEPARGREPASAAPQGDDRDRHRRRPLRGGHVHRRASSTRSSSPAGSSNGVVPAVCGEVDAKDFLATARANPFKDSDPGRDLRPPGRGADEPRPQRGVGAAVDGRRRRRIRATSTSSAAARRT